MEKTNVSYFIPELKEDRELILQIKKSCPKISDSQLDNRESVINTFRQMVLPLGQRPYSARIWRGRILSEKRLLRNRKKSEPDKTIESKKSIKISKGNSDKRQGDLDKIIINSRIDHKEPINEEKSSSRIPLKRPQNSCNVEKPSDSSSPIKRVKITWP